MIYFLTKEKMQFQECVDHCAGFPGFRIGQPRTAPQLNEIRQCESCFQFKYRKRTENCRLVFESSCQHNVGRY